MGRLMVLCSGMLVLALFMAAAATARAATYDADTVIVKYEPGAERSAQVLSTIKGVGASVVRVAGDPAAAAKRLSAAPGVEYAEPNLILRTQAIPNDARFGELWGMNNPNDADVDAPEGWDLAGLASFPGTGGPRVGIIDTGIDQSHPDLAGKTIACAQSRGLLIFAGQIKEGSCTDDNDHGSHVAGTIAGTANNGIGVAGAAFGAQLVVCKALGGPLGSGTTADVANCIGWVHDQGARVISMSLGGGDSATLKAAVQNAWDGGAGSLIVAAAGNDGDATVNYPAGYPEVVSVAATDQNDARAEFSNANADVEVAAPGVDVLSTVRGGGYAAFSGTSMATPHAAGVAAVIAQLNPGASAADLRARLDAAVDDLGTPGRDESFGFGRVNLCRAAGGSCAYPAGG